CRRTGSCKQRTSASAETAGADAAGSSSHCGPASSVLLRFARTGARPDAPSEPVPSVAAWPRNESSHFRNSSRRSGPSSTGSVVTFDPDRLRARVAELEQELGQPGFWDDQQHAAAVSAEHSRLTKRLERYDHLKREY